MILTVFYPLDSPGAMSHSKFVTILLSACSVLPGCDSPEPTERGLTDGVAVLTDLRTGQQGMLENGDGETVVTNLATGDRMIAPGELAGTMTDEEFTEMLAAWDRDDEDADSLDVMLAPTPQGSPRAYFSFDFTSDAWLSNTTPKTSPTSVKATVNAKTFDPFGTTITVELRRSKWGNDQNYGKQPMVLNPTKMEQKVFSWPTSNVTGDYYIRIDKNGWANGARIQGNVSF